MHSSSLDRHEGSGMHHEDKYSVKQLFVREGRGGWLMTTSNGE